jgi:hypothetical protein
VRDPGTEVSAAEIAGQARGPRGRWAKLLRRPRLPVPRRTAPTPPTPPDTVPPATAEGRGSQDGETKATPEGEAERHTIIGD